METGDWSILGLVFFRASLPYLGINSQQSGRVLSAATTISLLLYCQSDNPRGKRPTREDICCLHKQRSMRTRRTQTNPREDLKEMSSTAICLIGIGTTATFSSQAETPPPPRPPRDTKTFNPYTQLGTLTCKGRSQKSRLKSHWCRRVETRWRPEGEADKEQFNIHSAPRKLQAPR